MSFSNTLKSKLSWRITLTVFATILLVQTVTLIINIEEAEGDLLKAMRTTASSTLLPSLDPIEDQTTSPLDEAQANKIFDNSIIKGITIYNMEKQVVGAYGDLTLLLPRVENDGSLPEYRSVDNNSYEILFTKKYLKLPYYIIIRLDSSDLEPRLVSDVYHTLMILFLLSVIVTLVLMFVLGQWLLEPMRILRDNLLRAAQNPENPRIIFGKKKLEDELGLAINIANSLIEQNANNLKRLKIQAEDKIHRLAYYDNLTGLPNRTFFIEKLEEEIRNNKDDANLRLTILSVDIDRFKDINDIMGHEVGDLLLTAVGKRLVGCLPDNTIVSRASADEFMIMIPITPESPESTIIVEKVLKTMREPMVILQETLQVKISIGVAHFPEDGIEARHVVKNSDIALNRAKQEGRDTVRYYSEEFDKSIQERFQLLRDLRVALEKNQLDVYYHPQFDLKTGKLIGAEALLRWWRPNEEGSGGQFISPAIFVPIAEQSGLIVTIGEYVLKKALSNNKKWQDQGMEPFRIAINISGEQFHKCDLVKLVKTTMDEVGIDPKWVELEITESVFMSNIDFAIDILYQLNQLGVELAIDDFGTGYSSLSYLRQFPIDRLKIDQSFTKNALTDKGDMAITKTVINLAHSLGLKVIAEGVETTDHEDFLRDEGCDESQGFLYTKPIPERDFVDFVREHQKKYKEE